MQRSMPEEEKGLPHRGRGAQLNIANRFNAQEYQQEASFQEHLWKSGEDPYQSQGTRYLAVYPKSILNRVNSPDIGLSWSMNPYQGCEHGCTYCYARNSHEYWGYSAGLDFERNILYKPQAAALLSQVLQKKSWAVEPIMLSGNTDCYQPGEQKFRLTRQLLKVLLRHLQPVGIISKNALVLRDLDLLEELNRFGLVHVSISLTTLDEELRRKLEPRTASVKRRLQTIQELSAAGIPVNLMLAPIIPGLNSHEIMDIAAAAAEAGARKLNYTVVRLNGQIAALFQNWLEHHYPDRAKKVQHGIAACHGGQVSDSRFGRRMRGEGPLAEQLHQMIQLARKRFFSQREMPPYQRQHFRPLRGGQAQLDF